MGWNPVDHDIYHFPSNTYSALIMPEKKFVIRESIGGIGGYLQALELENLYGNSR